MIRRAWKFVYETDTAADFSTYEPAPVEAVLAYEEGDNGPGDTKVLDFSKGWERSRWNKTIINQLYNLIVTTRTSEGGWNVPNVSEAYIKGELYGQLKRAREAWSTVQPRFSSTTGRMETMEEVAGRVGTSVSQRLKAVASRSRRLRVS